MDIHARAPEIFFARVSISRAAVRPGSMDLPLLAPISCLADPQRRAIFESISQQPAGAAEVAARLDLPRVCVARHLRALEEARLVAAGAARPAVYRVDCAGWAMLRSEIDAAWARNTARLWVAAAG